MKRVAVQELGNHLDRLVRIQGWVQTIRDQKNVQFLVVRDSTGIVQVTLAHSEENKALSELVSKLTRESTVTVVGRVKENPIVKLGGIEIFPEEVEVEGAAESPLPVDVLGGPKASQEVRLNWRFLDLRRLENRLIFEVQTTAEMAMREFWIKENFLEIHSPKLMRSPSESGGELFELQYFGRPAYLAQSPQFYKQMAMAAGFERVFEIGPVFRANPSFTPRHDTEFTSVDVEMSWIESHEDVMSLEERWLQYVLGRVGEQFGEAVAEKFHVDIKVPSVPFPRISMREALAILEVKGYSPPDGKGDLDPQGERLLAEYAKKELGHEFVFVTDYPTAVRPFYHMRYESEPDITKSFDLLWRGVEVTTGAQREHRYPILVRQATEKGLRLEPIQFYIDFFRFGCPPHGGFGFGLTRMLMVMLGAQNVREVTYLYRGPTRLSP